MLERDATAMLMLPLFNYADGNHDAIREMMLHPAGVLGLSDGGAHCGMICDASYPTFLLTHWARDRHRGEKLSLEYVIRKQSRDTADLFGLTDRGTIEPRQEGRHQRDRHGRADAAPGGDGLGPAGRRKPDPAGRKRIRGDHRQRNGDPSQGRRHRGASRPVGARSALKPMNGRREPDPHP